MTACVPEHFGSATTWSVVRRHDRSCILLIALPLMLAVAMIIYADRKIWAAMALRRGPNVVGPFGLLQSFADGLKVFLKETIIPTGANQGLFLIAPIITFTVALIAWAVIPFDDGRGAGQHQCRPALHPRGLVARRLRRDHRGLGVQLEISVLQRLARRGADGVLRGLDRLRADLGRALGRHASTSPASSRRSRAISSASSTASASTRCCSRWR